MLERQTQFFDITLSSIKDFAYIFDRQARFIFVNRALLELWGLKLEEAIGKNFYELRYPDDLAARLNKQIQQVFDSGQELVDETSYTSPTGVSGYYEYIFRPVLGRDGTVEAVAGSTRDITQRKRVEEELRQSQERLSSLAATLENQVATRTAELEEQTAQVLRQSEKEVAKQKAAIIKLSSSFTPEEFAMKARTSLNSSSVEPNSSGAEGSCSSSPPSTPLGT